MLHNNIVINNEMSSLVIEEQKEMYPTIHFKIDSRIRSLIIKNIKNIVIM